MRASIRQQLESFQEQIVPPLSLELVLSSGQTYFVKWIFRFQPDDEFITIRIWDVRALTQSDIGDLLGRMHEIRERNEYDDLDKLHMKLDQANLHVRLDTIECMVEWHDRIWPIEAPATEPQPRRIGFQLK